MSLDVEHDGDLSPEGRAAVLGEVLRFIAPKIEPVPYGAVLSHVMKTFDAREELVSIHVMSAALELCAFGLITSNTYHSTGVDSHSWLTFEANTNISPSRALTRFTFGRVE